MSFVRNYIIDDEYVECPICNEYIQLELSDIDTFKNKKLLIVIVTIVTHIFI